MSRPARRALNRPAARLGLALLALGALAGAASASSVSYIGLLNANSPTHQRVDENNPALLESSPGANAVRYHAQQFTVDVYGSYTFTSTQSGYNGVLALYADDFIPSIAQAGCMAVNDDTGGQLWSSITATLSPGRRYVLVNDALVNGGQGSFTQAMTGPGNIVLAPTNTRKYAVTLSASSPTFNRPVPNAENPPTAASNLGTSVAFHVFKFRVDQPGTYAFCAHSGSYGPDGTLFLYASDFAPLAPVGNCMIGNDDLHNGAQAGFSVNLQPSNTYFLVTSTYANAAYGKLEVSISGPGTVETRRACNADYNFNGSVELIDIFDFLTDWFAGCP